MSINLTTISLILGSAISLYALFVTVRAWYDLKCSPYFFLRRQAEQQLQQYGLVAIIVTAVTLFLVFYTLPTPVDHVQRMVYLEGMKPTGEAIALDSAGEEFVVNTFMPNDVDIHGELIEFNDPKSSSIPFMKQETIGVAEVRALVELPAEYRGKFTSSFPLTEETKLGAISFSDEIDKSFKVVNPARIFDTGFYILYATFSYEAMADGMEWAWTWLYNGEIVAGGTQLWEYGTEGPGFVYYQPEEGFLPGEYVLQIWVNEELMQEESIVVTSAASR